MEGLQRNVADKSHVMTCGLGSLLDPRTCTLYNSPFWTTYVGLKRDAWGGKEPCELVSKVTHSPSQGSKVTSAPGPSSFKPSPFNLHTPIKVTFSPWMLSGLLAGLFIFYAAPLLASSLFFRISCGSSLFTLGSLLILLFILMRNMPHKVRAPVTGVRVKVEGLWVRYGVYLHEKLKVNVWGPRSGKTNIPLNPPPPSSTL